MAVQLHLFAVAWAELLPQIEFPAVYFAARAVLTAHDDTCVECHNADQRPRCPLRTALVTTMTRKLAGA